MRTPCRYGSEVYHRLAKGSPFTIAAAATQIAGKEAEIQHQPNHQGKTQISSVEPIVAWSAFPELRNRCLCVEDKHSTAEAAEASKAQPSERRWLGLRLFSLQKSQWPSPHLSVGIRCNSIGSNESWVTIGPAQELFAQISQSVRDLLDARIEDIEEGEPVVGHVFIFSMYMIGRDIGTARLMLIFTCQWPKPRRRAIKFIKEDEILKGHPKIALAESAVVPMAQGRNYSRLLASLHRPSSGRGSLSTIWIHRRDVTSTASHRLKTPHIVGIVIGLVVALLVLAIVIFMIIRRLKR
jgi:hypothetical protein